MSSDGDVLAFENSVHDNLADASTMLFNDKNWTFITDSTSNSGSFSSGQIQFDLSTLNSQSQWVDLANAAVEFPIKITAQVITAAGATVAANTIAAASSAITKNGWHSWIDQCQLIVNGQAIQSAQPYENVAGQFRILSSWSQDELVKLGPTLGVALDDCTGDADTQTAVTIATGMGNAPFGTVAGSVRGLDVVNFQTTLFNKGVATRNQMTNYDINPSSANIQTTILGAASMKTAGRSHVSSLSGGSNTANAYIFSAYYMATVRLKELADIKDFPMVKNLKGYLYLTFNSSQVNLTGTATTGSTAVSAVSITPLTGRTTPFLINTTSTGVTMANTSGSAAVLQIVGSVDATTTGAQTNAGPLLTNARLLCPYFIANPKADSALTQSSHFFTTLEKIVNPITCAAGASVNYTISVGVPNPQRLVLLPMWQNLGGTTNLGNPEISPFDSVPMSSSPWAGLNNLQVYLGNKPVYQYPIAYDFEQWIEEQTQLGLNGNAISEATSGLLSQQLWEQNHRFYTVDLSRRMDSEDGGSKSVQVSFTNPSSSYGLKVIAMVFYQKQWHINTATCQISSV